MAQIIVMFSYYGLLLLQAYLEELLRLRDNQIDELQLNRNKLIATLQHYENEHKKERQQLEGVIIELQAQM